MKNRSILLHKLGGYYLIPHELLHVLAYWIIGKRCFYQWGDWKVKSLQPKTRREKLFVLLFPITVCWIIGILFHIFWLLLVILSGLPREYILEGSGTHFLLLILGILPIFYTHTVGKDLLDAYGWLFIYKAEYDSDKPSQQTA